MTKEICTYVVIIIEKDWSVDTVDACYAQRTQRRSQIYALRHRISSLCQLTENDPRLLTPKCRTAQNKAV